MDKICCLSYLLYQADNEEVKAIAIELLNGYLSFRDIKKFKHLKSYISAAEVKIKKVDSHKVALFVEKFLLMEN